MQKKRRKRPEVWRKRESPHGLHLGLIANRACLLPSDFYFVVVSSSAFVTDRDDGGITIAPRRLLNDTNLSAPFSFSHKHLAFRSGQRARETGCLVNGWGALPLS